MIDIKDISGRIRYSTGINSGAKGKYTLMKEDYIILPFSVQEPVYFKLGDYVDMAGVLDDALGGKLAKVYQVVEIQKPTYNTRTAGYDYDLRLDAYYMAWRLKKLKYTPEGGAKEASFSLTAPLDVHLGVFLRNLKALGLTYSGVDYGYSIDSSYMERGTAWHSDSSLDPYGRENHKEADNLLSAFSCETVRILSSNLTGLDRIAVTLASQLEAKGLKAELIILDWAAFLERRKNPESWDIAITALTAVPLPLDKAFLSPDYPGWTDTDAYYILDDLVLAESDEIAEDIWQKAQMKYWEYIPAIVLGHYSTTHAAKDNVRNIGISSNGFSFLSAEVD